MHQPSVSALHRGGEKHAARIMKLSFELRNYSKLNFVTSVVKSISNRIEPSVSKNGTQMKISHMDHQNSRKKRSLVRNTNKHGDFELAN